MGAALTVAGLLLLAVRWLVDEPRPASLLWLGVFALIAGAATLFHELP